MFFINTAKFNNAVNPVQTFKLIESEALWWSVASGTAEKSYFQIQVQYAEGILVYCGNLDNSTWPLQGTKICVGIHLEHLVEQMKWMHFCAC